LAELQRTAVAAVEARHLAAPAAAGLALETLRGALKAPAWLVEAALAAEVRAGRLVVDLGVVRRPDFHPVDPRGDVDAERLVAIVVAGGLTAPNLKELERQSGGNDPLPALRMAAGSGRLRAVNQHWYVSAEALDEFALVLRELGAAGPIAVGAVRDRLGLTRKHLIPLLEWADAAGITVRRGDLREVVAPPA
jgi:selenocysteine-specific elongation factor